jgi:hypothetical protein
MHAVQHRLTVDEAAQLAARLPELIQGISYEGWDPSRTPARGITAASHSWIGLPQKYCSLVIRSLVRSRGGGGRWASPYLSG